MTIGLKRGTVEILPYDPIWVLEFDAEKQRLINVFGDKVIAIEHIGSTSIPGMAAKPIIDMNMAIESLGDTVSFIEPLQKLDYEYMPNRLFKDRLFFPKGPESLRTHHLSLVEKTSQTGWADPILFRDYLINHPDVKQEYVDLKLNLASRYKNDREEYTKAKGDFIKHILRDARKLNV